jgi:hypothetical protein
MKLESFFVIEKGGSILFYFRDLNKATEFFKILCDGEIVEIDSASIERVKKADKDGWRGYDYYHYITKNGAEFTLSSKNIEIYTKEEIEKIRQERKVKIKKLDKSLKRRVKNE